jgi:leader peptidase (prepilin peptidase)/N-methyltransferase
LSLIPIVSYLAQRGRCRHCSAPISIRYLLVELVCAGLGVFILTTFGLTWEAAFWATVLAVCVAHFVIDCEHQLLPHSLSAVLFVSSLSFSLYTSVFRDHLPSFFIGILVLLLIRIVGAYIYKQEALGMGDVIFMGAIGLFLPVNHLLLMLYIAFITGGAYGIAILIGNKKNRTDAIPFGPFLIIGFLSALFYGDVLLNVIWN